jgi:outer membrane protein assembly factor BamB
VGWKFAPEQRLCGRADSGGLECWQLRSSDGEWIKDEAKNIKWVAKLGSQTYRAPIVADGRVFVGTNNYGGQYLKRYSKSTDLGRMLCFRESDGKFLWQHSSEKLLSGRVHDMPAQGVASAPLVEGNRMWFVTNRGEVACLDTEGYYDGEDDGVADDLVAANKLEADVVWKFDMMKELGVRQHNLANCSITSWRDTIFVCTSNGVDETHINLPAPDAPSFIAMHKHSGEVLWTDNSPGRNILNGQWSSPAVGVLGGVPQVIFPGGDGWVYGFHAEQWKDGKPILLWKFDVNPKETKWVVGGRGNRNFAVAIPVIYDGFVYISAGQDPDYGEGDGHLWCIHPTKRGDVSSQLAMKLVDGKPQPIPHRKLQAVIPVQGEIAIDNPNSAVVWHYDEHDSNGDGKIEWEETFHRTVSSVVIKDDLLFVSDFSGLVHCLNAKTGKVYWTFDMLAASWGSGLIANDNVYIGDEDGDITIFRLSADPLDSFSREINMSNSVYSTPIVANNVLYIADRTHLFAIAPDAVKSDVGKSAGGRHNHRSTTMMRRPRTGTINPLPSRVPLRSNSRLLAK